MKRRPSKSLRRFLLLLLCAGALASCGTVRFYGQAAAGQAQMLWKAHPIPKVIAAKTTTAELRGKLELVQNLRAFAADELHLPAHATFTRYADLGRPYAVYVVYAAPEFSMDAKGWWYPVVGTLKYRGFFNAKSARNEAARLKAQGLDVLMSGVEAYSTLGWFNDPILNTFIGRDEANLADLIFHELTHARLFLPGDTDFNEALATAVGQEGVHRWFKSRHEPAKLRVYEEQLAKETEIIHMLLHARDELKDLYATDEPPDQMRKAKQAVLDSLKVRYAEMRKHWRGDSRYDRFFARPINNARLCTIAAYHDLVPLFAQRIRAHHGDLDAFFKEMEGLRDLEGDARVAALKGGLNP